MKTPEEVLDIKFYSGDLNREVTIREFFHELLSTLWHEGESFSGKRPFGNSGWESDLVASLIRAGLVEGKLDEDGYIEDHDWDESHEFIAEQIIPTFFKK